MTEPPHLPPLLLRCRPIWQGIFGLSALVLLALGTSALAAAPEGAGAVRGASVAGALVLYAFAGGLLQFFLIHCLSRLAIDEGGFHLAGPLRAPRAVGWSEVLEWRRTGTMGLQTLRIVHGAERTRLSVPLIYEDGHLLEVGLLQRGFPRW